MFHGRAIYRSILGHFENRLKSNLSLKNQWQSLGSEQEVDFVLAVSMAMDGPAENWDYYIYICYCSGS
jgi:hypothetical protein